jgi:hypothetical protein
MEPFNCRNLPDSFKKIVKAKLESVTDSSYQTNPANGTNSWLVEFMLQSNEDDSIIARMKDHLQFVNKTRPGQFESVFPELVDVIG